MHEQVFAGGAARAGRGVPEPSGVRRGVIGARALAIGALLGLGAILGAVLVGGPPGHAKTAQDGESPASAPSVSAKKGDSRPHVVLYVIDTLRADRLGVYGYAQRPTSPRIDALAKESVVFEQAHSVAPWTLPSVASLLTSTYPCEHRVLAAGHLLNPEIPTLATRMRRLGYATGAFYANTWVGTSGLSRDYEFFRDVNSVVGTITNFWTGATNGRPFFLYVQTMEPHDPYKFIEPFLPNAPQKRPPPKWLAQFGGFSPESVKQYGDSALKYLALTRADFDAKQPLGTTDNGAEQLAELAKLKAISEQISVMYDASVRHADDNLGTVIDALRTRQQKTEEIQWDNTLLIVTADHGEELGDRDAWGHDQSLYQELIHVPLIIRFPGNQFAGKRIKEVVTLLDVMPTVLEFVGRADLARTCRGRSLMPLVRGEQPASRPDPAVIPAMRHNLQKYSKRYKAARGDVNVVVRDGDWKAVWNIETNSVELYDLNTDPGEKTDLNAIAAGRQNPDAAHAERAAAMRARAEQWYKQCSDQAGALPPPNVDALDPFTRKQLEALGYAGGKK